MKLKTMGRVVGAVDTAVWSYAAYLDYKALSLCHADYNMLREFCSGDYPLEYKVSISILIGAGASLATLFTPAIAMAITDGLVDVVKGTHHYFGCKVWQKLTRNQERKEKIQRELEQMLGRIEQPISRKAVSS